MPSYNTPLEIHVHGEVPMRDNVTFEQIQEALKPIWKYSGAKSLADAAESAYEEEPGIRFDVQKHLLQMCRTVPGDDDFRQALDEMCMGLNELAQNGAPIEVTFYDADFDEEEDESENDEAREGLRGVSVRMIRPGLMNIRCPPATKALRELSWTIMISKLLYFSGLGGTSDRFLQAFRNAGSLADAAKFFEAVPGCDGLRRVSWGVSERFRTGL